MLLIDDTEFRQEFREKLGESDDIVVSDSTDGKEALDRIQQGPQIDVAVVRWELQTGYKGGQLIELIRQTCPELPVVALIAEWNHSLVKLAMERGACDCLVQPFDRTLLRTTITNAHLHASSSSVLDELRRSVIGDSVVLVDVLREVARIVQNHNVIVLILGEKGTGKGLLAQAIHDAESHRRRPFEYVDLSTVNHDQFESEIFGHEKGAYTGAYERHIGALERAEDGTLFLDEVFDLPVDLQGKLRQTADRRTFRRMKGKKELPFRARLICATNQDIGREEKEGRIKADLYDRLANKCVVQLPPLRERTGDVELLIKHFLGASYTLAPQTEKLLLGLEYPGNVRQLQGCIEVARYRCAQRTNDGVIRLHDLPNNVFSDTSQEMNCLMYPAQLLDETEKVAIREINNIFYREYLPRLYYQKAAENANDATERAGLSDDRLFWKKWDDAEIPEPPNRRKRRRKRDT